MKKTRSVLYVILLIVMFGTGVLCRIKVREFKTDLKGQCAPSRSVPMG
ncbi:hypothetical protein [Paenibacillus sp. GM2FR]|nr:hypothetical protein [Paenibacillus sp. GM2FR]